MFAVHAHLVSFHTENTLSMGNIANISDNLL